MLNLLEVCSLKTNNEARPELRLLVASYIFHNPRLNTVISLVSPLDQARQMGLIKEGGLINSAEYQKVIEN